MNRIITLTTDFGIADAYVAAMKGVILSINPKAAIVDISHSIEPQHIAQAAFVLSNASAHFPKGAIHVVVIDPEVGSRRRAITVRTPDAFFVAPDNGVLSYVLDNRLATATDKVRETSRHFPNTLSVKERQLPPGFQAVSLTNPRFWRHPVSATFHGRDIFAPIAAQLSLGVALEELGNAVACVTVFPVPQPQIAAEGEMIAHILHIDHFGNLITDARKEDLSENSMYLEAAGHYIHGLSASYVEGDKFLALIGSSGHLEIASRNDSAARLLDMKVGDTVKIHRGSAPQGGDPELSSL